MRSTIGGFVLKNFLLLTLTAALTVGVVWPDAGAAASQCNLQSYGVIAIFIISGLQLKQGEALKALQAAGSVIYGLSSILLLGPLVLAPAILASPLEPSALKLGLAVFACMPTSLSSGIAMTQTAGGNVALAILLTVASNLLAVATLPLLLPRALAGGGAAQQLVGPNSSGTCSMQLDPAALLVQLLAMVLAPTVFGACARAFIPGVAAAVDKNKVVVSCLSSLILAAVPWMQISRAMTAGGASGFSLYVVMVCGACGAALHAFQLAFNTVMCKALGLGGREEKQATPIRKAVVLLTSQKTLPVAVTIIGKLGASMGDAAAGYASMTVVIAHLSQIIVSSSLVSYWMSSRSSQAAGV
ncbi:hypothetical protein CEUSTIGMA_g1197.t1 [Chlamydomonas eustigma]|uniref:Sodium/bile acid cotransporter n=1 Tax=Chlamydomonas eustigma TaxID=1157962 RepID=A0A250WSD3_9CHLO|nr:hypothetical protein CEUSTIGMA_g1197.t1 [Chlamydomonas eustigma]|eukprot:GAX73745.1 hypothetical protein CEUSTIGMA_g1197.t1 [Chlamydomonas eustigma]